MLTTTTVGVPGNVAAEMARDEPGIDVVAAAGRIADDQRQRLALIEILGASGRGQHGERGEHE